MTTFQYVLFALFVVLGVLNLFLIHPVPGVFYMLLSLVYLPPLNRYLKAKLKFSIPTAIKLVVAFLVLWGTLGVGDLMELFEAWLRE
ncbi:MAG: hypothetical protein HKP38_07265 [Croceitalea sp.]|nr:hypothetical protein [Croceitalea sp.]NNL09005.1 hypothetical protein [Croceitalea sp.]